MSKLEGYKFNGGGDINRKKKADLVLEKNRDYVSWIVDGKKRLN